MHLRTISLAHEENPFKVEGKLTNEREKWDSSFLYIIKHRVIMEASVNDS